jgi:hypothetical protein
VLAEVAFCSIRFKHVVIRLTPLKVGFHFQFSSELADLLITLQDSLLNLRCLNLGIRERPDKFSEL